jgi:hypothetical protein
MRRLGKGAKLPPRPDQPGGQFVLRELRLGKWIFIGSFALAFLAILQSLIKAQDQDCFGLLPVLCSLKLFKPSDALAVFTGLMALFYTRKQIVDAQKPCVVYLGSDERRSGCSLDPGDTFSITIKNAGSGSAIVDKAHYHIGIRGQDFRDLSYDDAVDQLNAVMRASDRQFKLRRIGQGYALAKDSELVVFEVLRSAWGEVQRLDCDLDFRDVGGTLYRKQIFCVPRDRDKRYPVIA